MMPILACLSRMRSVSAEIGVMAGKTLRFYHAGDAESLALRVSVPDRLHKSCQRILPGRHRDAECGELLIGQGTVLGALRGQSHLCETDDLKRRIDAEQSCRLSGEIQPGAVPGIDAVVKTRRRPAIE